METIEDCAHPIIDEYEDGARECCLCGTELSIGNLMLKHLGLEVVVEEGK